MNQETKTRVGEVLKAVEAWRTGHFLLSSGLHSDQYLQCQRVMQYPRLGTYLADLMAEQLEEKKLQPDMVVGPALGAIHWELFVAGAIERRKHAARAAATNGDSNYFLTDDTVFEALSGKARSNFVKAIFAERPTGNEFAVRRGIEIEKGAKVLVVEDVTTTGGSARKVVELVRELGAEPIAVGAVADRSGGKAEFDVPFVSLLSLDLKTYEPDACPMCKQGSKAEKPGSSA